MKKKQRKSYTAAFKVKIALEAIKGQRTINEDGVGSDLPQAATFTSLAGPSDLSVSAAWREGHSSESGLER